MKDFKIRYIGDPVLAAKAKPVTEINDEIREIADKMIKTMYKNNGIGLAGNQVGLPVRIVVIHVSQQEDDQGNLIPLETEGEKKLIPLMPVTLINPEIVSFSEETCVYDEGCLSVPRLYADVIRSKRIVLKSTLLDGSSVLLECGGLLARCIQHELDHLEGIVFVQKAEEESYSEIVPQLTKLIRKNGWKNYKVKRLV